MKVQYDVSGLLITYSEKCRNATDSKHLKELVRDLKMKLNSKEILKMKKRIISNLYILRSK